MSKIYEFLKEDFFLILCFTTLIVNKLFPFFAPDISIIAYVLMFFTFCFKFVKNDKHKKFLYVFSVYIILKLVVFPIVYLSLLKVDANSFQFQSNIQTNEKLKRIEDLKNYYKTDELRHDSLLIHELLLDTSYIMNSKIAHLEKGNLVFLSNFIVMKSVVSTSNLKHRKSAFSLSLNKTNGEYFDKLLNYEMLSKVEPDSLTLKQYLISLKSISEKRLSDYNDKVFEVESLNDTWSYKQLIPYTINISSNGNMTPISHWANIVYYIDYLLTGTILAGFLLSLLWEFFSYYFLNKNKP
jgi:hypothetical protein